MKSDWIRSMRKKQGLKGFQLAEQLQVSAARVSVLEKDETRGAVTLKMMEKAAKAMGCKFEYRIVPLAENTLPDLKNSKPRYRVVQR
jgi:transcriptional regulator with XRE-family HTH domain